MNLDGKIIFSFLEEDNTQKGFFRVRPLLCESGLLSEDDIKEYQDHGFLRIVPDRAQQHTFKDRMRKQLPFCVINLTDLKPGFSKIRNNKNYAPQKQEFNRFIIYSDAVKSLNGKVFYEVIAAEDREKAATPLVFIRSGAKITGPIDRKTGESIGEDKQIMPDSADLYTVTLPDGKTRLIYMDRTALPKVEVSQPAAEQTAEKTEEPAKAEEVKPDAPAEESAPVEPTAAEESAPAEPAAAPAAEEPKAAEAVEAAPVVPEVQPEPQDETAVEPQNETKSEPQSEVKQPVKAEEDKPAEPAKAEKPAEQAKPKNEEKAPVDAYQQIRDMDKELKVSVNLLNSRWNNKGPETNKPQKPVNAKANDRLAGTPLYGAAAAKQNNYGGHRNQTIDAVERQRYNDRYEAAGAELDDASKLQAVENPVEQFRTNLLNAWKWEDSHQQIVNIIMEVPGMRAVINRSVGNGEGVVTAAMRDQLQEMEAERLMQLMRLDKLKADHEELIQQALKENHEKAQADTADLTKKADALKKQIETLTAQQKTLYAEQEKLIYEAQVQRVGSCVVKTPNGEEATFAQVSERLMFALKNAGFKVDNMLASAILIALCLDKDCSVKCAGIHDAYLAAQCITSALGAAVCVDDPNALVLKGGNGFAFSISRHPQKTGLKHITVLSEEGQQNNGEVSCVITLEQDLSVLPTEVYPMAAVNESTLVRSVTVKAGRLSAEASSMLKKLRNDLNRFIPAEQMIRLLRFVSVAQNILDGGIAAALDMAIAFYVVPYLRGRKETKELLSGYTGTVPYTARLLEK